MADAETLFAEHQPAVLRYLTRILGQTETARDLAQDVTRALGGRKVVVVAGGFRSATRRASAAVRPTTTARSAGLKTGFSAQ
jgi:hypothetical protein